MTNRNSDGFGSLFGSDSPIRKSITVDFERGVFHADTPEEAKSLDSILKSLTGNGSAPFRPPTRATAAALPDLVPTSRSGSTLKEASRLFLSERKATLAPATYRKHVGALTAYIKTTGNIDLALVTSTSITAYKQSLLDDGRHASTINDHLSILRGFFDHCIKNKVARIENPAQAMNIKGGRNQIESYRVFESDELAKIFNPVTYQKAMNMPDFYWCPLLALFTGARAEELASLKLDQIKKEDGLDTIHIKDGKTKNADRKVPIHSTLVELGFLEYVACLRELGYKRLFPHLIEGGKNGFRKNMCRKFGVYLDTPEIGISDPTKVFHSFRHTVVTKLTNAGVNEGLKRTLVGHDLDTVITAHDDYIDPKGLSIRSASKAINSLSYANIDFASLKCDAKSFMDVIARRIKQNEQLPSKKKIGPSK